MFEDSMYYLNNFWSIGLVRFLVYVVLAFVAANLASKLVTKLLKAAKLDEKFDKWGINEGAAGTSMKFVGKLVYLVVFLCFIPDALEAIGIDSVAHAISNFAFAFVNYLPNIVVAVVIVAVGVMITNLVCSILKNVLTAAKFDDGVKKLLPQLKGSATKVLVTVVKVVIILFVVAQGLQALNLSFFSMIVADAVSYLPMLVKTAAILLAAMICANLLENAIAKCCAKGAKVAKAAVYVVGGFMVLSQLNIAPQIVETAFVALIYAIAIAAALAFGLGGKDYAKKILDKLEEKEDK